MERIHKWNKDDTVISLYYTLYDLKDLPVKSNIDLAECVIGTTLASLQMQSANVRCALGKTNNVLTDFSKIQLKVVEDYKNVSQKDLYNMVMNIIILRNFEENAHKVQLAKNKVIEKAKELKRKNDLEEIFRKMGKDPSKMRKIC